MKAVNANFEVIGLTRLGIKFESTATEANALTALPSDLFNITLPTKQLATIILWNGLTAG